MSLDVELLEQSFEQIKPRANEFVASFYENLFAAYPKDMDKVQYGEERLCEVISENWHQSAQEIKDAIIADLRRHIGKQKVFDDITLLVLKRMEVTAEDPIPAQDVALA